MKTKHTPGPWKVDPTNDAFIITGDESCNIASLWEAFHLDDDQKMDESKANAHLIAAAPELLEALEQLVSLVNDNPNIGVTTYIGMERYAVNAAQKAIDKAKGE